MDDQQADDLLARALVLHQTGEVVEAERLYRFLLEKDPQRVDALHLLGILLGQQNHLPEALEVINKAVTLQPTSATFHNSLGNVFRRMGNIDEAIFHFQTALKIQPNSPAANNNLGILFQSENQLEKAADYYRKAIELKPDYADALYNLSSLLTAQFKFSEALQPVQEALRFQPEHIQANALLGQLLLRLDRPAEAITHYKARLQLDPEHADSHHQLAVAYTQQDQLEQAIVHYEKTLELQPDHLEALHNLGALYLVQRKPELALRYYLKILQYQPDLDAYYNIGVIFYYQDRHDDAIQYLKEALRLSPDYFNAHLNLGAAYLKKEDLQQAALHYEAALALQPENAEINYILAAISQKSFPKTAPKKYIEHLFDQYAPYFDKHLKEFLAYHVPELLFKAVTEVIGTQQARWLVLDLGCGTGLCGVIFRPLAQTLIGIDLSEKMLDAAQQKNIYDELKKIDIDDALREYKEVDLIIAGDVFGYVGDLEETFALSKQSLKKGGLLAFTVERTEQEAYMLHSNARFAHSKKYIEDLAATHGFIIERCENAILRVQKQQPVEGYVCVLRA